MKRFLRRCVERSLDVSEAPVTIVAFGDSVTQGAMQKDTLDQAGVYHLLLQRKLEAHFPTATFNTINAGSGGDTVAKGLVRLDRDVIRYQPDLVLIAFGLNDACLGLETLEEFQQGIRSMIGQIRTKSEADLLLLTPPFMASKWNARIDAEHREASETIIPVQTGGVLRQFANAVVRVGKMENVIVADVHAEWLRLAALKVPMDDWLINGLNHPDRRGHRLAAEMLWRVLSKTLFK